MQVKLSKQEHSILKLASEGQVDKGIAKQLEITVGSVRTYWDRIREKLGATNRAHAVALFMEQKLDACEENLQEVKEELEEFKSTS